MFRSGDVIKSTRSRHTTWRVLAVVYDGRLLAERVTGGKYRPDEDVKVLTRPESYHKVEEKE